LLRRANRSRSTLKLQNKQEMIMTSELELGHKAFGDILELLSESGSNGFADALRVLLNTAMLIEREKFIGAGPYERSSSRQAHANGFKGKILKTRLGELDLKVPQVREGGFYPNALEKGSRSEKALKLALAEMYVQGVSTRKVAAITEQLCGFEVSSSQVSRASAELDVALEQWRNRSIGCIPYLMLDARYEKVRYGGSVIDLAILIAVGVNESGHRQVLGVSVSLSEAEVHWREFLLKLKDRGLYGAKLITSDAHAGLKAAKTAVFPSVPWQRCQFHLQQNAQSYVPKQDMKSQVAAEIKSIYNTQNEEEAKRLLSLLVDKYRTTAPKLSEWLERNIPEGLTIFALAESHRKRLRTTNGLERVNKEIKRRTRVATLFPNEASCLRLVTAILMEISDDWETTKLPYISMNSNS
jgi:putative transposase